MVFRDRRFFFPNTFCRFVCAMNRNEDIVRESFSVNFILHSLWYTHLVYVFVNLFFSMWSSVCVICCCFFSQPDVNITWITGHIHRPIVDKIDPTSEDVEMVKNTLSIIMGYIFFWNVIRRIYLPCLQLISKKYFWWTATRTLLPFLVQKWKNGLWWHLWWEIVY